MLPRNLGLASALNVGVCYWLAILSVDWISTFNDDVDVVENFLERISKVEKALRPPRDVTIYSGYHSLHHRYVEEVHIGSEHIRFGNSASGCHLHAHRDYWQGIMPIPTAYASAPKPSGGLFPGHGSDVDWWITSWSPRAASKRGGRVVIIPGLVTCNAIGLMESTWGNTTQ